MKEHMKRAGRAFAPAALAAGAALIFGAGCVYDDALNQPGGEPAGAPPPASVSTQPRATHAPQTGAWSEGFSTTWPGPHLTNHGGPTLTAAEITPIAWGSGASDWTDYYTDTVASGYLSWLSEYGIGTPSIRTGINTATADPGSVYLDISNAVISIVTGQVICNAYDVDCHVRQELTELIDNGILPINDAESYYPVNLSPTQSLAACQNHFNETFGAYHNAFLRSGSDHCALPVVSNPSFDQGTSWTYTGHASASTYASSDGHVAKLCGTTGCSAHVTQTVTLPYPCGATGMNIVTTTAAGSSSSHASFSVRVLAAGANPATATPLATLLSWSGADAANDAGGTAWATRLIPLSAFNGATIQLDFYATTDASDNTTFYLDDVQTGSIVPYAIMPDYNPTTIRTPPALDDCAVTPVANVQQGGSHELIEAMTDPVGPNIGFADLSVTGSAGWWFDFGPNEAADICEYEPENYASLPNAHNRNIAFAWSNANNDCQMTCTGLGAPAPLLPSGNLDGSTSGWAQAPSGASIFRTTPSGTAHSAPGYAVLGNLTNVQSISTPTVTLPNDACRGTGLWFDLNIVNASGATGSLNHLEVHVWDVTNPGNSQSMVTFSGTDSTGGYQQYWVDLAHFKGDQVYVQFTATDSGTHLTSFYLDDIALNAQ